VRIDIEVEKTTKQGDYEQEIFQAKIENLIAKWDRVEPFRFSQAEESEEVPTLQRSIVKAKGLALLNIIKHSFLHPNQPTVISKKTGSVISES